MPKFECGQDVFVPAALLPGVQSHSAVVRREVKRSLRRSIVVDTVGGTTTSIASAKAIAKAGILLFRIGDYRSETELLDPLYQSLKNYFRLLIGDELHAFEIRTLDEFAQLWNDYSVLSGFCVIVAHGRSDAILFGRDNWISSGAIANSMPPPTAGVGLVSLACNSGYRAFSGVLSKTPAVSEVIAPHGTVHAAVASQFTQAYFANRLLNGGKSKHAFSLARGITRSAANFRRWKSGSLDS